MIIPLTDQVRRTVFFGGPAAIIFQAADAAHLDNGQLMRWIRAVSIGSGVAGDRGALFGISAGQRLTCRRLQLDRG
jgi:predicted benzoate:H+ symporter BenE